MGTMELCKKRKKWIIPVLCLLVLLCGIILISQMIPRNRGVSADTPDNGFQESYDRAWAAREYTLRLLHTRGIDEDHITAANYGFTAGDAEEYYVAFAFENGEGAGTYGYRVTVDEHRNCTVVAEGEALGEKLFFSNAEETE